MFIRLILVTFLCAGAAATHAQQTRTQFGPPLVIGNGEIIAAQPLYTASSAALRVFRHQDRGWDLAAVHVVDGVGADDDFASAMDLDRSVLAVGARSADDNRGTVYLFVRDASSGEWLQRDRLAINDPNARLGSALDLYGNVLVAGAPGIDAVLVVHNVGSDAQSVERLAATDQAAGIRFGEAVAYDGERIFVGAPGHDSKSGAVYVFRRTDTGFRQEALLTAPDYKGFGKALIAFAPGVVLATAPGLSIEERINAGEQDLSYDGPPASGPIFELSTDASGDWTQRIVVDSLRDRGLQLSAEIPMAADGARLFIGLPSGERKLQVYTREAESSSWPLTSEIENLNDEIGLGSSLASDGKHVAVLAPGISYEQVAIVLFSITTDGLERTDRLTLMGKITQQRSGPADCMNGAALHFRCSNVDLLAFLPISELGGVQGTELNDVWGWTDPETGREYALVGRTDGTSIVDLSDPSAPVFVGDLPLTEGAVPSGWRDIKVYNNHAFIVADAAGAHGMQVLDLTQLRTVSAPPASFEPLTTYDGVGSAHNIVINEATGFAYIVGAGGGGKSCGGGLHMVNIRDPAIPAYVGCFANTETVRGSTSYSHDAQCVMYEGPDPDYRGSEICFRSNTTVLNITDVTDKQNPITVFTASYPGASYAHQGWLTDDHTFFYLNDETDELDGSVDQTRTLIWDVTDLDDPQLAREFLSENTATDHNLYIRGNFMYQSNYASGLRIFDITDLTNPAEIGYFDPITTVPDAPGFIGSFSNYPYFESGIIIMTSMKEGLFVLKKREVGS